MDGERDEFGNLPILPFMRIAEGNARLIDKGTPVIPYPGESRASVGIQYRGAAPDLGCFETDEEMGSGGNALVEENDGACRELNVQVMRLAAGQLLVTLPDSEPLSKCAISLIDMSGRTIAAHTFYGNTTVVDATRLQRGCDTSGQNGRRRGYRQVVAAVMTCFYCTELILNLFSVK